jgi:hypothetical protein
MLLLREQEEEEWSYHVVSKDSSAISYGWQVCRKENACEKIHIESETCRMLVASDISARDTPFFICIHLIVESGGMMLRIHDGPLLHRHIELDDTYNVLVRPSDSGRIAAGAFRNVIGQFR